MSAIRFLADENFDKDILRGVARQRSDFDVVLVLDVGLAGADDPDVLAWAAEQDRVILTHDVNTMIADAWVRVERALQMPGVYAVAERAQRGRVIDDIVLVVDAGEPADCRDRVLFLPF